MSEEIQTIDPALANDLIQATSGGTIFQRLARITAKVGAIEKDQRASDGRQNYKFRGIDDVLIAMHPLLAAEGVIVVPGLVESTRLMVGKDGNVPVQDIDYVFRLYGPEGDHVMVGPIKGQGLDTGDKGANKALSVAMKYMFISVFSIPTSDMDDPDQHQSVPSGPGLQDSAQPEEPKSRNNKVAAHYKHLLLKEAGGDKDMAAAVWKLMEMSGSVPAKQTGDNDTAFITKARDLLEPFGASSEGDEEEAE